MSIFIITGISGSGKSVALHALEDAGFECVDNLPINLLTTLIDQLAPDKTYKIAITIDARRGVSIQNLPAIIDRAKERHEIHTIFLNASTEALVKRFSETRRRHPLSVNQLNHSVQSLEDAIEQERALMAGVSEHAHQIDTSNISSNTLRSWLLELVHEKKSDITVLFESFGFKNGVPHDADIVFDARCIPNPYYENALKHLTGNDQAVIDFLMLSEDFNKMYEDINAFVKSWLPKYQKDGRSYLTVAVGCTGGQHRSVALINKIYEAFKNNLEFADLPSLKRHRDIAAPLNSV